MHVLLCTFPSGEDPDSFVRNNQPTVVKKFLDESTVDFVQFKAKLLAKEGNNEPIRKAETIREIVHTIALIPDAIRREIYIQDCASTMNISEDVLFSDPSSDASKKIQTVPQAKASEKLQVVGTPKQKDQF